MKDTSKQKGSLNASEVLQILADIEIEGIEFYMYLEQACELPALREAAGFLIKAEQRHRDRFLDYARNVQQYAEKRIGFELLHNNVRLLHNTRIFPSPTTLMLKTPPPNDADLLRLAIEAERANVVLIQDFAPHVLVEHHHVLEQLIKEELQHVERLERFMKKHFSENA